MPFELIRHTDMAMSLWPNKAGRKADILSGQGWLVGFAWLDADAAFSDYRGHDRTITLIDGPGFVLRFPPGTPALDVAEPNRPRAFDGGWPTHCAIRGPCLVLNAVTRRPRISHSVAIDGAAAFAPAATTVAVVLDGEVATPSGTAARLDAIVLRDGASVSSSAARMAVIRVSGAEA
jgi:environmental stress-induced protein Ves